MTLIFGLAELSNSNPTDLTIEFELTNTTLIDDVAQIQAVEALEFDIVLTHETCNGDDGEAEVSISGGSANIIWSTFASTPTIFDLSPGNYFVVVSDAVCGGTPDYIPFTINAYGGITIEVVSSEDIIECPSGLLMGSIEVEVTGAMAPYTVSWIPLISDGEVGTDQHVYNAWQAGTVQCIVEDINLCAHAETLAVSLGDPFILSLDLVNMTPVGALFSIVYCPGSLQVEIAGSSENFFYSIEPNEGSFNVTNDTFENMQVSGFYQITATIDSEISIGCSVFNSFELDDITYICAAADLNGDGVVGFADLQIFSSAYGSQSIGPYSGGDLDGDSLVGYTDAVIFASFYNTTCDCD